MPFQTHLTALPAAWCLVDAGQGQWYALAGLRQAWALKMC